MSLGSSIIVFKYTRGPRSCVCRLVLRYKVGLQALVWISPCWNSPWFLSPLRDHPRAHDASQWLSNVRSHRNVSSGGHATLHARWRQSLLRNVQVITQPYTLDGGSLPRAHADVYNHRTLHARGQQLLPKRSHRSKEENESWHFNIHHTY